MFENITAMSMLLDMFYMTLDLEVRTEREYFLKLIFHRQSLSLRTQDIS